MTAVCKLGLDPQVSPAWRAIGGYLSHGCIGLAFHAEGIDACIMHASGGFSHYSPCAHIAHHAGGIDASVSARGPVSSQHAQMMAHAHVLAQRGAATARAGDSSGATAGTLVAAQAEQPQLRNESRASTVAPPPPPPQQQASEDVESGEEESSAWESGALSPGQALRRYTEYLTPFEQTEILDFPEVFFVGRCGAPKIKGNPALSKTNGGYDDERGDYTVVAHDHLAYRYEVLSIMGKGSFGQVRPCGQPCVAFQQSHSGGSQTSCCRPCRFSSAMTSELTACMPSRSSGTRSASTTRRWWSSR